MSTGIAPIKQALVRALRDNSALTTLVGADGIQEGVEPRGGQFPYVIYQVVFNRRDPDHTNLTLMCEVDIWSLSADQVEAHTLDQLVSDSLEVDLNDHLEGSAGQTSLLVERIGDMSSADVDDAGNRVYQMGGAYRIWTDQTRTA